MDWNEISKYLITIFQGIAASNTVTFIFWLLFAFISFVCVTMIPRLFKKKKVDKIEKQNSKQETTYNPNNSKNPINEKHLINVPHRNIQFSGREDILKTLFENANTQAITKKTIHGLGGIGKSSIATEYAYRNKDNYRAILWINAESFASLSKSYIDIAKEFELPVDEAKPNDIIRIVNKSLYNFKQNEKWLIIFDNAENRQAIEHYLPKEGNGHVLITSRNPDWDKLAEVKQIDVFTEDEALDFLADKIGVDKNSNEEDLKSLAKTLGYLPLALEQAGAYIKVRKKIIAEYIREFEEKRTGIFKEGRFNEKNYPLLDKNNNLSNLNVVTTWQISFEKIKEDLPETIAFLNLIAFLAPDNISISWFKDRFANIDNIIDILNEFSLIKQEKNNPDNISIHRLLQMVIRDSFDYKNFIKRLFFKNKQKKYVKEVINIIYGFYDYDYHKQETWENSYLFIPHVEALKEYIEELNIKTEQAAYILNETGCIYDDQGNYNEALKVYLKAINIKEKVLGVNHPDTATSYNSIGNLYHNQGNYNEALKFYFKATDIYEKKLGVNHPDTAIFYNNIGAVYNSQSNYDEALKFYFKATDIYEKKLGVNHPDTATSYNNIGAAYDSQGNYDEALKFYLKALNIREKVPGVNHPDTATSYNNIGLLHNNQGNYDEALKFYFKATDIYEKKLGGNHPDTATFYNNIGEVHRVQGNYDKALKFYFKATDIYEKKLGVNHPSTANSYNSIGAAYDNQGNYDEALKFYFKSLNIREKVLGVNHPSTATSYNNIGLLYKTQGNYDEALKFYFKSLNIREKVLGVNHPSTATSYNNIGLLYKTQGNYDDEALKFYFKALNIREKVLGVNHPDTATSYNNIAGVYYAQGNYDEALKLYNKAYEILKNSLGESHPNTLTVKENIESFSSEYSR